MSNPPNTIGSQIRIQRMLGATREPRMAMPHPATAIRTPGLRLPRIGRAAGGIIDSPAAPFTGPIMHSGGGRTDDVPMHVPDGSYVIPAWAVSHIGEGNTLSGMRILKAMFGAPWSQTGAVPNAPWNVTAPKMPTRPMPIPQAPTPKMAAGLPNSQGFFASGGHSAKKEKGPVPIMASGGEFVIPAEEVTLRGGGDNHKGHAVLDHWVNGLKKEAADTIRKLPGPAK